MGADRSRCAMAWKSHTTGSNGASIPIQSSSRNRPFTPWPVDVALMHGMIAILVQLGGWIRVRLYRCDITMMDAINSKKLAAVATYTNLRMCSIFLL